jgi:hypothetical protein
MDAAEVCRPALPIGDSPDNERACDAPLELDPAGSGYNAAINRVIAAETKKGKPR